MSDFLENDETRHIQLFLYLLPVFGFFPALWTLYNRSGGRQERALSRLVIKLSVGWLIGYVLLGFGASSSDSLQLPILLTASLLTSGYFLVNFYMMVQLWQRKPVGLPLVGKVGRLP